jgi:hypothetical protein
MDNLTDDVEDRQDHLFGIQSPTIVNSSISGSDNAAIPVESSSPVVYEPPFNGILTQGSTCLIARVKSGVIIKCTRGGIRKWQTKVLSLKILSAVLRLKSVSWRSGGFALE